MENQTPLSTPLEDRENIAYVVCISLVAALGGLLFGYDTGVISGAIGYLNTFFSLSPAQTGWAASSALLGCVIGAAFTGLVSDYFGRKKALFLAAVFFLVSAIGTALPRSFTEFIIYRIIGGIGVGAASMLSPLYIAEVSPARIRGRLISVNQLAIVSGILASYFVNYLIAHPHSEQWNLQKGWRWMFGAEAFPAAFFLILLFFVPESPRWLIKQTLFDRARAILRRINGRSAADLEFDNIRQTIAHEETSIAQLFHPGIRFALLIGIVLAVLQQASGINVFMYYAPEIFKKLGSSADSALLQTVIIGVFNMGFTFLAIGTVDKWGRKPLILIGAAGMGISMIALGTAAYFQRTDVWLLLFILGYISCFALSVGPVVWVIIAEIFPTRIRGLAMSLSIFFLWTTNYIISQTFPMMDASPWLLERFHHGFPFWIYGALCFVMLLFTLLFVPETKNKTLEQIESSWTKNKS